MFNNEEIDKEIKIKFDQAEFPVSDVLWANIRQNISQLPLTRNTEKSTRSADKILTSIGIGLISILAISIFTLNLNYNTNIFIAKNSTDNNSYATDGLQMNNSTVNTTNTHNSSSNKVSKEKNQTLRKKSTSLSTRTNDEITNNTINFYSNTDKALNKQKVNTNLLMVNTVSENKIKTNSKTDKTINNPIVELLSSRPYYNSKSTTISDSISDESNNTAFIKNNENSDSKNNVSIKSQSRENSSVDLSTIPSEIISNNFNGDVSTSETLEFLANKQEDKAISNFNLIPSATTNSEKSELIKSENNRNTSTDSENHNLNTNSSNRDIVSQEKGEIISGNNFEIHNNSLDTNTGISKSFDFQKTHSDLISTLDSASVFENDPTKQTNTETNDDQKSDRLKVTQVDSIKQEIIDPLVSKSSEKEEKKRFDFLSRCSFDVLFAPQWNTFDISSNLSNGLLSESEMRKQNRNYEFSFALGLRMLFKVYKNFNVHLGVFYNEQKEKINYNTENTIVGDSIIKVEQNITPIYDTSMTIIDYDTTYFNIKVAGKDSIIKNTHSWQDFQNSVTIPLGLSYSIRLKNVEIGLRAQINTQIITNKRYSYRDNNLYPVQVSSGDKTSVHLSGGFAMELCYNVNKHIGILLEPGYMWQLNNMFKENAPLQGKLNSFNLNFGLRFKF